MMQSFLLSRITIAIFGNYSVIVSTRPSITPVRHLIAANSHQFMHVVGFTRRIIPSCRIRIFSSRPKRMKRIENVPALSQVVAGFDHLSIGTFLKILFQAHHAFRTPQTILPHCGVPALQTAFPCTVRPGLTSNISRIVLLDRLKIAPIALRALQLEKILRPMIHFTERLRRFAIGNAHRKSKE